MFRKLKMVLGVKGLLCLASLIVIALALVTYATPVTIAPTKQFTLGAASASWTIYVNDVDRNRYLPGSGTPAGSQTPSAPNDIDVNTFAFKVVTDTAMVSAVKIELTSAVDNTKFSKFQITAMYWNGSAWVGEILYAAATGATTKAYIDGLTAGDAGYIHHTVSLTRYYLIKVTYSYDLVDTITSIVTTFRYTPLPQASF